VSEDEGFRLPVNSGYSACLPGGGVKPEFTKKNCVKTNKVIYDDPSTRDCVCCGDWDTECEPEYSCEDVINHCATCSNPWDITCESDSSDDHDDGAKVDALVNCVPCESAGRQMCVRECKCEDTTCYDQTIEDIRDAFDSNLDEIEPRNAGNIRRYPRDIIDQYKRRHAPIDDSETVQDDYSEVCVVNEERQTFQDDDDSLAIDLFLGEISEDID
jgi:hypothetical protein